MQFILGLLLAIPIGIVTNLMTPWARGKLASGSAAFREGYLEGQRREAAFIKWLAKNPHALNAHLMNQRLRALGVITGTFSVGILGSIAVNTGNAPGDDLAKVFVIVAFAGLSFWTTQIKRKIDRIWSGVLREAVWPAWDMTIWSNKYEKWVPFESAEAESTPSPPVVSIESVQT